MEKQKNDFFDELQMTGQPQSRSRNPLIWACAFGMAALVCLCCALPALFMTGIFSLAAIYENNAVSVTETQSIPLEPADLETGITLDVSNQIGETRITGADVEEVTVEIRKQAGGLSSDAAQRGLEDMTVEVRRDGDRIVVEVNAVDSDGINIGNRDVDLRITVPRELNVIATSNAGSLIVRDVVIRDRLDLRNDFGEIEFEGQIGPDGVHRITSNVGEVSVDLDLGSAFALDASTDVGDITLRLGNRWNGSTREENVTGTIATGTYGDETPDATLTITTDAGDIVIED